MNNWIIDTMHTDASFKVRHLGIMNIRGSFGHVEGSAELDENQSLKFVKATIHVDSLLTRNKERDAQLLDEDFFYAEVYPTMDFNSTTIVKLSENNYEIEGNLSIRGITQKVTLEVVVTSPIADPFGYQRIGLEATTKIDRRDFGINFNQVLENGGLFIGNKIDITIDSEIISK